MTLCSLCKVRSQTRITGWTRSRSAFVAPRSWGFPQVIPLFLKVPGSMEGASCPPNVQERTAVKACEVVRSDRSPAALDRINAAKNAGPLAGHGAEPTAGRGHGGLLRRARWGLVLRRDRRLRVAAAARSGPDPSSGVTGICVVRPSGVLGRFVASATDLLPGEAVLRKHEG